ncbi:MAG: UbiH/UbiF/VisC/COQ6 family ubiquinone biosynthesis hydroxylase [Rhodanobacteraceae bacterium]
MSRRRGVDAIIVGAGPIGSATALALARDGFGVAVIEAHAPKPWTPGAAVDLRVVALAADGRDLLDDLDAWSAIARARVSPYRRMRVWDALAPGELGFDAADRGEAALGFIVENRLIQHALWQALTEFDGDGAGRSMMRHGNRVTRFDAQVRDAEQRLAAKPRVCCPAQVAGIEQNADDVVAILADGTRLAANVLIAADGAGSPTRSLLGVGFKGRDYRQRAVVAHVATERVHGDTAWQRFLPGGPLALLPLADGRSSIVWSLPEAQAARVLALNDDAFCRAVGAASDFRLGAITQTTARQAFPLRLRLAERYVAGRCVLIGDAAHVVHPLAGQGMNLGLRDVACLRRVLGEARMRGSDIGAAHVLRRYERERRSENALAAHALDAIERVFDAHVPAVALLRGAGLGLADRIAPLKHLLADIAAGR